MCIFIKSYPREVETLSKNSHEMKKNQETKSMNKLITIEKRACKFCNEPFPLDQLKHHCFSHINQKKEHNDKLCSLSESIHKLIYDKSIQASKDLTRKSSPSTNETMIRKGSTNFAMINRNKPGIDTSMEKAAIEDKAPELMTHLPNFVDMFDAYSDLEEEAVSEDEFKSPKVKLIEMLAPILGKGNNKAPQSSRREET